jgi:hypothetical protein
MNRTIVLLFSALALLSCDAGDSHQTGDDVGWTDYLARPNGRVIGALHIEGCPLWFVSEIPTSRGGTPWTAPTDTYGNSFTYSETLKIAEGVEARESRWDREKVVSAGGQFRVSLHADSTVRDRFATKKTGINSSRLTTTVDHDDLSFVVESTSGFAASGFAYRGKETFRYSSINATTFTVAERGTYGFQPDSVLSRAHLVRTGAAIREIYVTDHPTTWRGKRMTLMLIEVDEHGNALGLGWTSDAVVEVKSGFVSGHGYDSWRRFQITANDLTYPLVEYDIGRPMVSGPLTSSADDAGVYVDANGMTFSMSFNVGGTNSPETRYQVTDDGLPGGNQLSGFTSTADVAFLLGRRVNNIINTATGAASVEVSGGLSYDAGAAGQDAFTLRLHYRNGTAPADGSAAIDVSARNGGLSRYFATAEHVTTLLWDAAAGAQAGAQSREILLAPMGTTVPVGATEIPVRGVADESGIPTAPPTSGYAEISNGEVTEIIHYTGTSALSLPPSSYLLTGCTRGLFGTVDTQWTNAWQNRYGSDGDLLLDAPVTITFLQGWGDESATLPATSLATIALQSMISTGTTDAYSAVYDKASYGLAIDPAAIDIDRFVAVLGVHRRKGLLEDSQNFADMMKGAALLGGFYFAAETDLDGRYRITVHEHSSPLEYSDAATFSVSHGTILTSWPARIFNANEKPIDDVTAKVSRWSAGASAVTSEIRVIDGTREQDDAPGRTLTIPAWGMTTDGYAEVIVAAERLFGLYDPDEYLVEFATDRTGDELKLGDPCIVTIPNIPNPEGGSGLTDRFAIVMGLKPNKFAPGDNPGVTVRALLKPSAKGWSPSFKVTAYNAGTPSVTLADNIFTSPGQASPFLRKPCRDWHFGPDDGESYAMTFYLEGSYSTTEDKVCTYASDGTWTLNSAFSVIGAPPATPFYCHFAEYDHASLNANQKRYAYVADAGKTLGAASDAAHEWVA